MVITALCTKFTGRGDRLKTGYKHDYNIVALSITLNVLTSPCALFRSRRVRQVKFFLGMDGADLEQRRAFVLAGLPTTNTYENGTVLSEALTTKYLV